MSLDYSSIVSLLVLLVILHCSYAYTIRSIFNLTEQQDFDETNNNNNNNQTIEQLRHWNQSQNNDEIEIPLNETLFTDENSTSIINLIEFNQTTEEEIQLNTTSSTINETDEVQTTTTFLSAVLNDTSTNSSLDEIITNYSLIQKDAIIINSEISRSTNETFEDSTTKSIPICDQSCQCLKECPYGFDLFNDTCQCHSACQNYPCFGNDTCVITDNGKPWCQSENGTQHDRPNRCYQPRDAGYHDENIRYYNRWYYNPEQDACHLFVYRGLGGNENNFHTLNECHLDCITCAPLPDTGDCLGHITMWYFDRYENICRQFEYSGCKGNENKFLKKEQCIETCIHRRYNL